MNKIEEIIADIKQGKIVILVDDESRENEGDLVVAAEFATPDAINFMAKHGRGLICLCLDSQRVNQLNLPLMTANNRSKYGTAFTVSIGAKDGITTGISAYDRAKTVEVAIDETKGADDLCSPGHVFPLTAKDGGVLVRAGHTEGSTDLARLAGLKPAAVLCEVMKEDGTMARLPDLEEFAKEHNLKIGSIADLIAYRRQHESLIEKVAEEQINTSHGGEFKLVIYKDKIDEIEHMALVKGDLKDAPLVRMHVCNILNDIIGDKFDNRDSHIHKSMQIIKEAGQGAIIFLRSPEKDSISQLLNMRKNHGQDEKALRNYGIGAQILQDLGIHKMRLITNSPQMVVALDGYGLEIEGYVGLN